MGRGPAARIRAEIDAEGPITFARYMELALYGPGGFYDHPPVGPSGDFVTSPHVHPVFGELLARAISALRTELGTREPFRLVEIGAGDGTLARQLLAALDPPVAYTAVEISAGAREALAGIDGVDVASDLPPGADLVLAHELLDNLPFRVTRRGKEVRVGLDEGSFVEVMAEPDDEIAAFTAHATGGEDLVVPVGAFAFVDRLATVLRPGYALLIDYGGVGATGGPVHGYRGHRVVDDLLREPGTADITSGVDLAAIASRAREVGLTAFEPVTQRDALVALGFDAWLRDELARQRSLLDERDGVEAVRAWSGRSRATLLADPAALGRLRWLVVATPGLAAPSWIRPDEA